MKTAFTITITIALVQLGGPTAPLRAACSCEAARKTNSWCAECKVGYVASIRIPSRVLFEVLDAHGHDIDPDRLWCGTCIRAFKTGGFCESCGIGFFRKQAYLSRLAWSVATGEVRDPSTIDCATCRKNAEGHGWCDSCGIGMVGNLALRSRADMEKAAEAFSRLRRALRALARCEACAVAMFAGGRCPFCRISYRQSAVR